MPRAQKEASNGAPVTSGVTWVPAEDGRRSLAAQSVANICVEGGGSIAGHQSVVERSVSTSVEVEVASSDFLAASSVG